MGLTWLCVPSLFLLNTLLYCGHAEDAVLTFEPNSTYLFSGEHVIFKCDMKEGNDTDWHYTFNRNGQEIGSFDTKNLLSLKLTADWSGDYQCVGRHKGSTKNTKRLTKQSNNVTLSVSAQKPVATLRAERISIPVMGSVMLACSVEGSADWKYDWFRHTSDSRVARIDSSGVQSISISQGGIYKCRGRRGNPIFVTGFSDVLHVERTLPNRVVVMLRHNRTQIFSGETITVTCQVEGSGGAEWEYEWRTTTLNAPPAHSEYRISSVSVSHSGQYWCKGRKDSYSSTEWSKAFQLIVASDKPRATVLVDRRTIPVGGNETLTCSVDKATEWMYYWFRRASVFSESQLIRDGKPDRVISVSQGGIYHCRGGRGNPVFFTEDSHPVAIEKRVPGKAAVSLQPNWPLIFSGESITVRCDIHRTGIDLWRSNNGWEYEWSKPISNTPPTHSVHSISISISSAAASDSGNYRCMGKQQRDLYSSTEWSDAITLTVSTSSPKAVLSADNRAIPAGGSVTLTCSVNSSSSGWRYFWYRGKTFSNALTSQDVVTLSTGQISVSQEGLYWCIGGRGDPIYYTEYSDPVNINRTVAVTARPVVTQHPNWTVMYFKETITLRCEIEGGDAEWEYEWMTTSSYKPPNGNEYRISSASLSHNGDYWCKGRSPKNSTGWSISFKLSTSYNVLNPVLTVSPSWLSPGDSVALSCSVRHPSAGWSFYWYKVVPKPTGIGQVLGHYFGDYLGNSYSYELLPGSTNGTDQGSYMVHGQTHTAGYVCRAGRGDPVFYSPYSEPTFVWSGDVHPAASLTVSPDRVQHFVSDFVSVSLNCGGNATDWRVRMFPHTGYQSYYSYCSHWGTMTRSTCHMSQLLFRDSVYWCESGSGEFSNAVNITAHDVIILVSPVHPVTEGQSVTLGCMWRTKKILSNVTFYKNGKLIQNDSRGELKISAASKSDEGFYGCEYSADVSPQSWMSVKSSSSPFPVLLIAGLVSGILLIVLLTLVLLCWYKKSKDTCCHRPIHSHQSFATVQTVNRDENQQQLYSSLLHGDVCVYDTIIGSGNTEHGEQAHEYRTVPSPIQFSGLGKRRIKDEAAESSDYTNVIPDSTAGP